MAKKHLGYVYFIRCPANGLIRIGWTRRHPDVRFRRISATSPVPLERIAMVPGTIKLEEELHIAFLANWSHGEWFKANSELERYIAENGEPWPDRERLYHRRPVSARAIHAAKIAEREAVPRAVVAWANRLIVRRGDDRRTLAEWAEELDIPLLMLKQCAREGWKVDIIGYYQNLRALS